MRLKQQIAPMIREILNFFGASALRERVAFQFVERRQHVRVLEPFRE